jgi:hypothetical protein
MLRPFFEVVKNRISRPIQTGGRRAPKSLCPTAEVLEGRQLMTGLYANSASVTEKGTAPVTMNFVVDLTAPSTTPVTVNYQTAGGTAISGTDFVAASGTLTFAPGTTQGTIPVQVLPDLAATTNLSFTLSLSGAQGATILTSKLAGTIVEQNTPTPPSLTIANQTLNVGANGVGGTMTFTASLNVPVSTTVTVTATTANLTAMAGVDYTANSQVLAFAPGQTTAQFTVIISGETTASTKYFMVNLTNASVALTKTQASGTIVW